MGPESLQLWAPGSSSQKQINGLSATLRMSSSNVDIVNVQRESFGGRVWPCKFSRKSAVPPLIHQGEPTSSSRLGPRCWLEWGADSAWQNFLEDFCCKESRAQTGYEPCAPSSATTAVVQLRRCDGSCVSGNLRAPISTFLVWSDQRSSTSLFCRN